MDKKRVFTIILCIVLAQAVLLFTGGCKPKDSTARITFNVEGQEFSDAEISIDGKSAGRMEQTIIKSNGELYINGQLSATLPPGSPQIGKEDTCSGVLDSITLKAGRSYHLSFLIRGENPSDHGRCFSGISFSDLFPRPGNNQMGQRNSQGNSRNHYHHKR